MVQEFGVDAADRSTSNYDAVQSRLNVIDDPPTGLLVHTAGFPGTGLFRIFGVWESEQDWQRFREERLVPAVAPLMASGAANIPNEYILSSTETPGCAGVSVDKVVRRGVCDERRDHACRRLGRAIRPNA